LIISIFQVLAKETAKKYKELQRRQEREKQLRITAEKMIMKKALMVCSELVLNL
jgi:hypothetical protein